MKKILTAILLGLFLGLPAFAENVWINDLRNLFLSNNAIIYAVNIRTFGAQDTNNDGIIDNEEESGTFLNAIGRLDEIQAMGINTLHILPVMRLGQTHAFGTAGNLYSPASFTELNPQFKSRKSMLSAEKQFTKFINEAHRRNIRIILDLPSCGSYDLYSTNPELFIKNQAGQPVQFNEHQDLLILNGGTESQINQNVYKLYKDFTDYAIMLGADGIRADMASLKPAAFWKDLIEHSRRQDPQFMWLAEQNPKELPTTQLALTNYVKLLEAGFDGIYGDYSGIKDWKKVSQLENQIKINNAIHKKFAAQKSIIGDFSTLNDMSPVLINGIKYSEMILWLNSTLPLNSYYIDGFPTGDTYIYLYGNKQARATLTDDNKYSVHRGQMDIFNFSRKPEGKINTLVNEFIFANQFKKANAKIITNGKYKELSTSNPEIFAYAMSFDQNTYLVFGNINYKKTNKAIIKIPHLSENNSVIPVKIKSIPITTKNAIQLTLEPAEIQILFLENFNI